MKKGKGRNEKYKRGRKKERMKDNQVDGMKCALLCYLSVCAFSVLGQDATLAGRQAGWLAGSVIVVKQSIVMCIGRYSEERKLYFKDKQPIISTPHHITLLRVTSTISHTTTHHYLHTI